MKRAILALTIVVAGVLAVQLIGSANGMRVASIVRAELRVRQERGLFARATRYCGAHGAAVGVEVVHVFLHGHQGVGLPIADALQLPIGRSAPVMLLLCFDHTQGYVYEPTRGKTLTYFLIGEAQ